MALRHYATSNLSSVGRQERLDLGSGGRKVRHQVVFTCLPFLPSGALWP